MLGRLVSSRYPAGGGPLRDVTVGRLYEVSFAADLSGVEFAHFTDDEGVYRSIYRGRALFDFDLADVQIPDAPAHQQPDAVNHPSHYNQGGIECIDAIRASMSHDAFCGFLKGNQIKYLWRYESKGKAAEDLGKSNWYGALLETTVKEKEAQ